ncbi:diphthine methyltransferase-like isoform X1 [Topomyia yanbarensis]|uniref:diphthine methyltransferase-like isoform X1 n=1 Tax=Topomyia yanbarensis TaxID=2498891 RepID=UPI00273B472A|nr:diphthine methyltransferase-like isoform X1 [Topomyia yanbarensis]XP_058821216.1 diphthine methyltransferase-like isoform X1 [Topomyia yanbarensis]
MPSTITTLHTYDTEYSADSVEWCPHSPHRHLFVCGTYQLDKDETNNSGSSQTTRKGRILLFSYNIESNSLTLKQTIETSAILDQKWHQRKPLLAVVNANSEVILYNLSSEDQLIQTDVLKIPIQDEGEQLALSLDWTTRGDRALVSDSKGGISVIGVDDHGMHQQNRWKAHNFEAWTCAFDKSNDNIVYTGGDDAVLCIYDIRCLETPIVQNKSHDAGITSLLAFQHVEHLLATGSYDDNVRIFDTRFMKSPASQINLGGGIWRMKSNYYYPDQILCACMYHNFSIINIKKDYSIVLDSEYNEHNSICYGCDWSYDPNECESKLFASCSFYDHKLCLAVLNTQK